MENNVSEKRMNAGCVCFAAALIILTIGCWNEYSWYEVMAPLGTLISFVLLAAALFCCTDLRFILSDRLFILMIIGDVIALAHLFIIKSNKGAFLTACDFMLVLYLFDKLVFPRLFKNLIIAYLDFYLFYWTIDVKGYFKGYNTNYGGLVLLCGFIFALVGLFMIRDFLCKRGKITASWLMYIPIIFMFAWGYNIIAWYRARCALVGLLVFALVLVLPQKLLKNNIFYFLMKFAGTFGAVLISVIYVLLGKLGDKFTIRIFYKDIISGREEIWSELWSAFLRSPFTGIGSSYVMKLSWMEGMFEVHNGLLDILFVHGIAVFLIVVYMMFKRFKGLNVIAVGSMPQKCAFAGIYAILAASFMENFVIVPPFLLCLLMLGSLLRN